ncbi:hypothetical protein FEM48_Zijuj01G0150900 [Ziziphus jujuba var. spinosa]|uniref:Uncharacterized protein n=1 Tax=Ziziphus jujuba var. spinosa TaxID=714518 RepID=A0A978W1Y9_ZIZJJ|nr:hypothetical protein FEM48_Zijuj01G0150900 [Ziziphus jujuba var. spinosa]
MSSTGQGGPHSLAFRVMRLCRPSFHVDPIPLRLDPSDLLVGEDIFDDPIAASQLPRLLRSHHLSNPTADSDLSFRTRFLLRDSTDSMGLSGLLVLPQAFGSFLFLSVSLSLFLSILVCTALYNDGDGERKYLPQFFKFIVANPLSVRTKVRVVKDTTFLETCIENHTKSNLFMDQVEFEPAQHWSTSILKADEHHTENNSINSNRETFKPPVLIKSGGGIHNYLYQLKLPSHDSPQTKVQGSNVLGKLQITWRTNLGEPGRLQTQQILGNYGLVGDLVAIWFHGSTGYVLDRAPITYKEIELHVVEVPSVINLDRPFTLHINLTNLTEKELGPFEVWLSENGSDEDKVVVINGPQIVVLPRLEAFGSTKFTLNLIATKLGVQKITGITVFNTTEKKSYDPLPDLEVSYLFVLS